MPTFSVTTTARQAFAGSANLESVSFKNGSNAGILYFINKKNRPLETVSSTVNDFSLTVGQAVNFNIAQHGKSIRGTVWDVISDTGGGVTCEVTPLYDQSRSI